MGSFALIKFQKLNHKKIRCKNCSYSCGSLSPSAPGGRCTPVRLGRFYRTLGGRIVAGMIPGQSQAARTRFEANPHVWLSSHQLQMVIRAVCENNVHFPSLPFLCLKKQDIIILQFYNFNTLVFQYLFYKPMHCIAVLKGQLFYFHQQFTLNGVLHFKEFVKVINSVVFLILRKMHFKSRSIANVTTLQS